MNGAANQQKLLTVCLLLRYCSWRHPLASVNECNCNFLRLIYVINQESEGWTSKRNEWARNKDSFRGLIYVRKIFLFDIHFRAELRRLLGAAFLALSLSPAMITPRWSVVLLSSLVSSTWRGWHWTVSTSVRVVLFLRRSGPWPAIRIASTGSIFFAMIPVSVNKVITLRPGAVWASRGVVKVVRSEHLSCIRHVLPGCHQKELLLQNVLLRLLLLLQQRRQIGAQVRIERISLKWHRRWIVSRLLAIISVRWGVSVLQEKFSSEYFRSFEKVQSVIDGTEMLVLHEPKRFNSPICVFGNANSLDWT